MIRRPREPGRHPARAPDKPGRGLGAMDLPRTILIGALPGAVAIIAYAIQNRFFPYLVGSVPTLQFVLASAVVALVTSAVMALTVMVGTSVALFAIAWIPILATFRRGRRTDPHPFIPGGVFERAVLAVGSLLLSVLLVLLTAVNLLTQRNHGAASMLLYFLLVAIVVHGLVRLQARRRTADWRLLGTGVPLAIALLFVVPQGAVPLLNLFMTTLGFRSAANQAVLVDDEAHRSLEAQAAFTAAGQADCMVESSGRSMWYLPDATVIWQGVGESTLIDSGRQDLAPLVVRPDQYLTVPRLPMLACGAMIAGPASPH